MLLVEQGVKIAMFTRVVKTRNLFFMVSEGTLTAIKKTYKAILPPACLFPSNIYQHMIDIIQVNLQTGLAVYFDIEFVNDRLVPQTKIVHRLF